MACLRAPKTLRPPSQQTRGPLYITNIMEDNTTITPILNQIILNQRIGAKRRTRDSMTR